jgi:hypothetical protein
MARPKRMGGRVALYIPPGVAEQVDELVRLRTERQAGLPARAADVYREAVVRGLPLVLAAERGGLGAEPGTEKGAQNTRKRALKSRL